MPTPQTKRLTADQNRVNIGWVYRVVAVATVSICFVAGAGAPAAQAASPPERKKPTSDMSLVSVGPPKSTFAKATVPSKGWTQTFDLLDGTQMVSLSWDGKPSPANGRVALRSKHGNAWSRWSSYDPDEGDNGSDTLGRVGTEIIWLGTAGAEAVEIRVDAGPLVDLRLMKLRYHNGDPVPTSFARTAQPTIKLRSDYTSKGWQYSNEGCASGPLTSSSLKHAVIHHTASTNAYSASDVPGILDGVRAYHQSLGWCDTGYNFIVDRFGTIWQGRSGAISANVIGSHAKGFNTNSLGIALLGQFQPGASPAVATPSSAMNASLQRLLAWKLSSNGLNPKGTYRATSGGSTRYAAGEQVTLDVINYHRLTSTTSCPGQNVIDRMTSIRDGVESLMGETADPRWTPFSSVEALVWRQYVDFRRDPGTYEGRRWWAAELTAGRADETLLVATLLKDPRVESHALAQIRLYLAYFKRTPDHDGIDYWWSQADKGMTIREMSSSFVNSSEFRTTYGGLTNAQFVDLVYRNVIGRSPDAQGRAFWVNRLDRHQESRSGVMTLFSESAENRSRTKVDSHIMLVYEAMLGRQVSADQLTWWRSVIADKGERSFIESIFQSPSYTGRVS